MLFLTLWNQTFYFISTKSYPPGIHVTLDFTHVVGRMRNVYITESKEIPVASKAFMFFGLFHDWSCPGIIHIDGHSWEQPGWSASILPLIFPPQLLPSEHQIYLTYAQQLNSFQ